jgi:hypothetical protein
LPQTPASRAAQPRTEVSRLVTLLHFTTVAAALLSIPACISPWDEWSNSKVRVSGSHTAGVQVWGLLSTSNIPFIAAVVGMIALGAALQRSAGIIHRTAGLLSVVGGLWIGFVTVLDVYRFPNDDILRYEASTGVYFASAMALTLMALGITIAIKPK